MSSFSDNYKDKLDSFWSLSEIVPRREIRRQSKAPDTDSVEISFDAPSQNGKAAPLAVSPENSESTIKRFIPPFSSDEIKRDDGECDEYRPDSMLIQHVRIYNWKSNYNYYSQFLSDAVKLYKYGGKEAQHQKFFSYVPQYSQMNREQLLWYMWWRTNARKNVFLETDYSYILLYIFEIINLGDKMDVKRGLSQLIAIWSEYRETYPQLDRFLGDWICDYGLINHVLCDDVSHLRGDSLRTVTLKEYFLSGINTEDAFVEALLAFATNYDYRKSKFAVGENRALYDKHIRGAVSAISKDYFETGTLALGTKFEVSKIKRDSYVGAICSSGAKKKIEVEFLSFAHSYEVRYILTDVIKYAENKLRAYLGVKSRLSICALSAEHRALIDEYFALSLPRARNAKIDESHAYDKLYDLPKTELSVSRAKEIEANSWDTTKILIETFEENNREPLVSHADKIMPTESISQEQEKTDDLKSEAEQLKDALGDFYMFLTYALGNDFSAQRRFCEKQSLMLDALADKINNAAIDIIGDILLYENGGGYSVIDEYVELFDDDN